MPIARREPQESRVIAHVDMDCFYVQVEQRKQPQLRGLPTAVVQYNPWQGGGLIAVGYEARKFGVKRSMRGDEAKKVCPDIHLIQVPVARGKADLNLYRNAGSEVVSILAMKGRCERASIDEVYLDLTDAAESMLLEAPPELLEEIDEEVLKSHVLGVTGVDDDRATNVKGWLRRSDADHRDKLLACGAIIVARLRAQVLEETKFTCSAGVAHNKMLAKLASAMNKPAQQTVVPSSSVTNLLASFPVKKMKQLGGKLGSSLQSDLGVNTVGDLLQFSEGKLQERYGINTGSWLWNTARGINGEEVEARILPKSHSSGKTFPGVRALKTTAAVEHWLNQLCEELSERIQSDFGQNKRMAHTLTLHAQAFKKTDLDPQKKFPSKSCPLRYGTVKLQEDAKKLFDSGLHDFLGSQTVGWGVTSLSVTASKIIDMPSGTCSILRFFQGKNPSSPSSNGSTEYIQGTKSCMSAGQEEQESGLVSESTCDGKGTPHEYPTLQRTGLECEDTGGGNDTAYQGRMLKKSGKLNRIGKHKASEGTSSIRSWFTGSTSSFSPTRQPFNVSAHDHGPLFSGSGSNPGVHETENRGECALEVGSNNSNTLHDDLRERSNAWNLKIEDIDPSVIDELPLEIQREVQGWLRSAKRANTAKQGSSISHYFSPAKNS